MISGNFKKRLFTSIALLISLILIFKFNLLMVYFLIILGVFSIIEFLDLSMKIFRKKSGLIFLNSFFITYIFSFCFMFLFLSYHPGLKIILYIILLGCVASDIGGFIFGKTFKGPKLTKISPNKTYAGSIGSTIFTLIIMTPSFYYFTNSLNLTLILTALTTTIFCQLGDLIFSLLKRKAKLKDTGSFLPGHGGVLDRLDGILLGVPIGLLTLVLLLN